MKSQLDRAFGVLFVFFWILILWSGIHLGILMTRQTRIVDGIALAIGFCSCVIIAGSILSRVEVPAKDIYDTFERQKLFTKIRMGRVQSKEFYEIVRTYITRSKMRNWDVPKYAEVAGDKPHGYCTPDGCTHHYFSTVIQDAFRHFGFKDWIIERVDGFIASETRVGNLRELHEDPDCHYVITVYDIAKVCEAFAEDVNK